jgi:hypothetical protein
LIHLYLKGYDEEQIYNFDLYLTNPSTVMEMMQLDLVEKRFALAAQMAQSTLVDDFYVQKEILQLSDKEIVDINERVFDDARKENLLMKLKSDAMQPFMSPQQQMAQNQAAGAMGGGGEEGNSEEQEGQEESTSEMTKSQRYPGIRDLAGTSDIPYAPKYNKGFVESNEQDEDDKDFDRITVDPDLELFNKEERKEKKKKKRSDPFDRKISDVLRVDRKINKIVENLQADINEGSLSSKTHFDISTLKR